MDPCIQEFLHQDGIISILTYHIQALEDEASQASMFQDISWQKNIVCMNFETYSHTVKSPLLAALELKTPLNSSRSQFLKLPNLLEAALKHKPQLTWLSTFYVRKWQFYVKLGTIVVNIIVAALEFKPHLIISRGKICPKNIRSRGF